MRVNLRGVCIAMLWVPLVGWAAEAATVDLRFVELRPGEFLYAQGKGFGRKGQISYPFATASGKVLFQREGEDRVRVDSNGDGVVDENDAPAVGIPEGDARVRIYVDAIVGGAKVKFPLDLKVLGSSLMYTPAAALEGRFQQYRVRIYDTDMDGRFGTSADGLDLTPAGKRWTDWSKLQPWSRVVKVDSKLTYVELLKEGMQIKFTAYEGPVAEVMAECDAPMRMPRVVLREVGDGQTARCTSEKAAQFVPGKYRIDRMDLKYSDGERQRELPGFHRNEAAPFELVAGRNTIKVGPPFKLVVEGERCGNELRLTRYEPVGVAGEAYRPNIQSGRGDEFAAFARTGGVERKLEDLMFLEREDSRISQYPYTVVIPEEVAADAEIVFRMRAPSVGKLECVLKLGEVKEVAGTKRAKPAGERPRSWIRSVLGM